MHLGGAKAISRVWPRKSLVNLSHLNPGISALPLPNSSLEISSSQRSF